MTSSVFTCNISSLHYRLEDLVDLGTIIRLFAFGLLKRLLFFHVSNKNLCDISIQRHCNYLLSGILKVTRIKLLYSYHSIMCIRTINTNYLDVLFAVVFYDCELVSAMKLIKYYQSYYLRPIKQEHESLFRNISKIRRASATTC